MDATPQAWHAVGDAGAQSERALRDAIAGGDFLQSECLRRRTDVLRESLLPEDASQLEHLAVQRLIVSWLQVQLFDIRLTHADGGSTKSSFWIKSADAAHRRFASALSQLQSLQKLLGRPVCRAAVDDAMNRNAPTDDERDSLEKAGLGGAATTAPEQLDRNHTASTQRRVAEHPPATGETRTPSPNELTNLSGILPFRMSKPA